MKYIPLLILLLLGVGCATTFDVQVTKYHAFQITPDKQFILNKSFNIVPIEDRLKGSLEFENTAKLISNKLQQYGMTRHTEKPDLLVFVGYAIDNGVTQVYSDAIYGQYGVVGYDTGSDVIFTRTLTFKVVDVATSTDGITKVIYEAKSISRGSSGIIDNVVPYMIEAIFWEFPGENGKTKRYDIPESAIEDKKKP